MAAVGDRCDRSESDVGVDGRPGFQGGHDDSGSDASASRPLHLALDSLELAVHPLPKVFTVSG